MEVANEAPLHISLLANGRETRRQRAQNSLINSSIKGVVRLLTRPGALWNLGWKLVCSIRLAGSGTPGSERVMIVFSYVPLLCLCVVPVVLLK